MFPQSWRCWWLPAWSTALTGAAGAVLGRGATKSHLKITVLLFFAGVYEAPYNLIFFPTPIFLILDFLPKNFRPLPLSPLDILPNNLNIIGNMIPSFFSHVIFFLTAIIFPSPPRKLINFQGGGYEKL